MEIGKTPSREFSRTAAIQILIELKLPTLTTQQRESHMLGWWQDDPTDPRLIEMPDTLKLEMKNETWCDDVRSSKYDPLILAALRNEFYGVENEYILEELNRHDVLVSKIKGEPEPMEECPCCRYRSLTSRRDYDICPVCRWEDEGSEHLNGPSGPNHISLRQGRDHFEKLGICDLRHASLANPDARRKFRRSAT